MAPSTNKLLPLIQLAFGLHKKTMESAISSEVPIRPIGSWDMISRSKPGAPSEIRSSIGVSTHDGQTQFTRIECLILSSAGILSVERVGSLATVYIPALRVKPTTACFDVV